MGKERALQELKQEAIRRVVDKHLGGNSAEEKIAFGRLLEDVIDSLMLSERKIFLAKDWDDKANGFYDRSLSTSLGKLDISVPRDREDKFRPAILPGEWIRGDDSYRDLLVLLNKSLYSTESIGKTLYFG